MSPPRNRQRDGDTFYPPRSTDESGSRDPAESPERLLTDGGLEFTAENPSLHEFVAPVEIDAILDTLEEGILLVDDDLRIVAVSDAVLQDTGASERDVIGLRVDRILDFEDIDRLRDISGSSRSPEAGPTVSEGTIRTKTGEERPAEFEIVPRRPSAGSGGIVVIYRLKATDTERRQDRWRQERLGLVNQFNSTLRSVTRSIVNPTSREELEDAVCNGLAAAAPYEFAVIVERNSPSGQPQITPRSWAGIEDEAVEEFLEPVLHDGAQQCPLTEAIATGDVQVAGRIDRDPSVAECLNRIKRDISSVAVVPIRFEETLYGVLAVYSGRDGPFEDFEIRMLEEIGEIVAFAYNTVDKDELLSTDTIVELEIELTDPKSYFVEASAEVGGKIVLESVVPTNDERPLYYTRVVGGTPDRLLDLADESPMVENAEVIREHEEMSWFAFRLNERSLVDVLAANNVNVQSVVADAGVAQVRLEICPTRDVDSVIGIVETMYSEFELVAKRRCGRPASTTPEFRHEVLDALTNKQRKTLEAAYQNGYFERPRGNTAEEIATQLGISSSTFHQHLRAAMSKLMVVLLNSEPQQLAAEPT